MKHHDYEQIDILKIYKHSKRISDSISTQTKEHEVLLFAIITRSEICLWGWNMKSPKIPFGLLELHPIHTERERCQLENEYGTQLPAASLVATLVALLGANGAVEINVFLS